MPKPILDIKNYHNDFLILKSKDPSYLAKIGKSIFGRKLDFVEEVIVTPIEICLKLNRLFEESKIELLQKIEKGETNKFITYQLPIYFNDHEDWENVRSTTGFSKEGIIEKLVVTKFSISMFGFLPGFIYLEGLDPSLHVPRKKTPSKYVKANSIALGGKYVGLYSIDSPGGWHVVGQIPISILDIPQLPPVEMNLGDQIKLHPIDQIEFKNILQKQMSLTAYNNSFPK
ncbi:MAG: carboxyltransferase domain-containing protein [Saprospiraceae bacterium]